MLDKTNWTAKENRTLLEPWRKVLLDAADFIEAHGLWKGGQDCSGQQTCAANAILAVSKDGWSEAQARFAKFLGGDGSAPRVIFEWNDVPARTKTEVVAALRDAAHAE